MTSKIESLSWEAYQSAPGISNSMLKWMSDPYFPAHFRARFITGELKDKETKDKAFGTIFHRAVLEPDTMDGSFHVKPEEMTFTTKEGKSWRAEHQDKPIIEFEKAKDLRGMIASIWRHPTARALLTGCKSETAIFAEDSEGTLLKGRIDCIPRGGNALVDIKSIESVDHETLTRSIYDYGWFRQGAFYLDLCKGAGIKPEVFTFIFVEKHPPYITTVRPLGESDERLGRILYKRDLALHRHCVATNTWPGDPLDGQDVGIPDWRMKQAERQV